MGQFDDDLRRAECESGQPLVVPGGGDFLEGDIEAALLVDTRQGSLRGRGLLQAIAQQRVEATAILIALQQALDLLHALLGRGLGKAQRAGRTGADAAGCAVAQVRVDLDMRIATTGYREDSISAARRKATRTADIAGTGMRAGIEIDGHVIRFVEIADQACELHRPGGQL